MSRLADMAVIANVSVDLLELASDRVAQALKREPTLNEVAEVLAISYGAARGAMTDAGANADDLTMLTEFVELAAADAGFCMQGLREAGL